MEKIPSRLPFTLQECARMRLDHEFRGALAVVEHETKGRKLLDEVAKNAYGVLTVIDETHAALQKLCDGRCRRVGHELGTGVRAIVR